MNHQTDQNPARQELLPQMQFLELCDPFNLALIGVIRRRKPHYRTGNKYREALSSICEIEVDHAPGMNKALWEIAQGEFLIPPDLKNAANEQTSKAESYFEECLNDWRGGQANE
jgi:hypothetical protein